MNMKMKLVLQEFVPNSEFIFMVLFSVKVDVTVTLLSIAARIALVP